MILRPLHTILEPNETSTNVAPSRATRFLGTGVEWSRRTCSSSSFGCLLLVLPSAVAFAAAAPVRLAAAAAAAAARAAALSRKYRAKVHRAPMHQQQQQQQHHHRGVERHAPIHPHARSLGVSGSGGVELTANSKRVFCIHGRLL